MNDRIILEMDPEAPVRFSPYGFGWGPALVTRMCSWRRRDRGRLRENFAVEILTGQVIANDRTGAVIDAPRHRLHVYVSRTGRSVQVYLDGRKLT